MSEPYNPQEYWTAAPAMQVRPEHADQEVKLLEALQGLKPKSILEIGVGFGRVGKLLCEEWPDARYTGVDISPARIAEAREILPSHAKLVEADFLDWDGPGEWCDLVIAVEVLMHVRPSDLGYAVEMLRLWSRWCVVTVDWTEPIDGPVAPWNFLHNYAAYGAEIVATVGKQSIHRWDWW